MRHFRKALLVLILLCSALALAAPAAAAPRIRCFAETQQCISGPILGYWERNGGLAAFGLPITAERIEQVESWSGPVQWFERDRLENHGAQGILAGRLAAELLEREGRPWQSFPQVAAAPRGCRYFPETRHSLCGVFLRYWEANGGLARFGYPLAEPFEEQIGDWRGIVQYFERRRMEHHTELVGTRYEVLLGLLGNTMHTWERCADGPEVLHPTLRAYHPTLCATTSTRYAVPLAFQQFERGSMLWIKGTDGGIPSLIYVVFFDNASNGLVWQIYFDHWREGEREDTGQRAPSGLYAPIRGFGKVWAENKQVHDTLGWALAPEVGDSGIVQGFQDGSELVYRSGADRVSIFFANGRADDIVRIR